MAPKKLPQWKKSCGRCGMLLHEIMLSFGGEAKLMRYLCKKSKGELCFPIRQTWLNWRNREHVPLEHVFLIARILEVSPFALNYRQAERGLKIGSRPEWPAVVGSCKFLNDEIKKTLIGMKQ